MIARKEIARRFEKWLEGQGETFTIADLAGDFEAMFPEVDDPAEAEVILNLLVEAETLGRALNTPREIERRFERFIASKPVGSQFTVEEMAAEVFPEMDEATARREAYAIAKDLGWEGDPWLRKAR